VSDRLDLQAHPDLAARRPWLGPLVVFALFFAALATFLNRAPVLYDTDSYYHLAIARAYAEDGVIDGVPWARFSVLHQGFGDKEVLFHLLLAPFTALETPTPSAGGRWFLALLGAAVAALLAFLAQRPLGIWGWALPVAVFAGSQPFLSRLVRLRPEVVALFLFLLAAWLAGRGRYRLLGLVAFVFTLSYTAFHALLGLCFLWWLGRGWTTRRWPWPLLAYPLLGAGLALIVHPHFPHNLVLWKMVAFDFFALKNVLDVGEEIGPATTDVALLRQLGLWLFLAALWLAGRARPRRPDPLADAFLIGLLAFAGLYLLMARFVIYFAPFAALAVAYDVARRGGLAGLRRPFGEPSGEPFGEPSGEAAAGSRRLFAVALGVALLAGVLPAARFLYGLASARGPVEREAEWADFGRAVPAGARVAAEWGSTALYMFWAPQATYLNVLDPMLMALPHPRAYAAERAVFEGREPDVPLALARELDSDHLAVSTFHPEPRLLRRLASDPRVELRYAAFTRLYAMLPDRNQGFVLDWRLVPKGSTLPAAGDDASLWRSYPRAEEVRLRRLEGFVDLARLDGAGDCQALVHDLRSEEPVEVRWEFAPYGRAALWLDDRQLFATGAELGAVLGQGLELPLALAPGPHRLTVLTCPAGGRNGFYLLERRRTAAGG